MNQMPSATIAAHSGEALLTRLDGTTRLVQSGDSVQAGETIVCPASAAVIVRSSAGELIPLGPETTWQVPESWLKANVAGMNPAQEGVLEASRFDSLAAHSHLFLSAGRAWEVLSDQLALPDTDSPWSPSFVEEANVASALEESSALLFALEQALATGDPENSAASKRVSQLRETLRNLEKDWTPDADQNAEAQFAELIEALGQAETLALDWYAQNTPGSLAGWEDGSTAMRFAEYSPPSADNEPDAAQTEVLASEVLDIDLVLEGVTEYQLDDVLTLSREGGSLEVSVQGDGGAADSASIAVALSSYTEPLSGASWASVTAATPSQPE